VSRNEWEDFASLIFLAIYAILLVLAIVEFYERISSWFY
jgi:hypothetical protein